MAAFVFDASGIVKRYVHETGSAWVRGLTDPSASNEIFLSRITRVEVIAAVTRRGKGGQLAGQSALPLLTAFRHDAAHQYNILEITPVLLADAEQLAESHGLRAYDAVQLAVAMALHRMRSASGLSPATFISADQELNSAATAEGLAVDDPRLHP